MRSFIYAFFIISLNSFCQEKIIFGKVIGQDLLELPNINVASFDGIVLDTTDFNGNFRIQYKPEMGKIIFKGLGYQQEELIISENCDSIEIIILENWIYDFVSLKKAERKEKRNRKKLLTKLYSDAFERKIFTNGSECRIKLINNKYCW